MTTYDNCRCPGNICTCSGSPRFKDGATAHIPLMMKDAAGKPVSIEDAAKSPAYDAYRGLFTDDHVPMEQRMAMLDIEREIGGGRADAYHDVMIEDLTGNHPSPATHDAESARRQMIADLSSGR